MDINAVRDLVADDMAAVDRLIRTWLRTDVALINQLGHYVVSGGGKRLHCGVLEFIAQEGMVYLPYWMMENMGLNEGDIMHLRSATLPKGKYVKLQPQTTDFIKISNPKAVLEQVHAPPPRAAQVRPPRRLD